MVEIRSFFIVSAGELLTLRSSWITQLSPPKSVSSFWPTSGRRRFQSASKFKSQSASFVDKEVEGTRARRSKPL